MNSLSHADLAGLRIVEIGALPVLKNAFPNQTAFFSTFIRAEGSDPSGESYVLSPSTLTLLWQKIRDPDVSLIVCHPTFFSPWHWRWLARMLFHRRIMSGHFSLARALGPQLLRAKTLAPVAILDREDIPVINRNNFFLLDGCDVYFKRELPADRWRLFFKTGHANLPTPRFRGQPRYARWLEKVHPVSLGPHPARFHLLPVDPVEKTVDVFFSGRIEQSSSIRVRGMTELAALKEQGVVVDIPGQHLPPDEFYRRCARAHLTWSPEGLGWDCFRHYEAPVCRSVPVINHPGIERYAPLIAGEHAFFYDVEPGGLTRAILAALADKPALARMAEAGRRHVLAHHSPSAIARHVVETTLGLRARAVAHP